VCLHNDIDVERNEPWFLNTSLSLGSSEHLREFWILFSSGGRRQQSQPILPAALLPVNLEPRRHLVLASRRCVLPTGVELPARTPPPSPGR